MYLKVQRRDYAIVYACVITLSLAPGIAVEAGWSAADVAAAAEEELSSELQLSAGPEPEHTAA